MPNPTGRDLYIDEMLTNLAVGFAIDDSQFIADRVFPRVSVQQQTGKFWKYKRQDWYRLHARTRAPGTESAGGQYSMDQDTFSTYVWAFHKDVDRQDVANASRRFNLERDAVRFVTFQLLLAREYVFQQNFFKTGIWTGGTTATDLVGGTDFEPWNSVGSKIIDNIEEQSEAMALATGHAPNTLLIGRTAWRKMRQNTQMLDAIKYTQRGVVTKDLFAEMIGIPNVIIADGVYDASADGAATPIPTFFYGNNALLVYANPSASEANPSAGYIFTWDRYSDYGIGIESFDHRPTKSTRYEGEFTAGPEIVAPDMGIFFSGVTS